MFRRLTAVLILAAASLMFVPTESSACGRSYSYCYSSCCYYWEPCCYYPCYCLAYEDPYALTGAMLVKCSCCPGYLPSWQYCYVLWTGKWEWVKVFRRYYYGTPLDKDAKGAKGYTTGSLEGNPSAAPATIALSVPENAKVTFDGNATTSTSGNRTFITPDLEAGKDHFYTLKAEITRNGLTQSVTRRIAVRAGQESKVLVEFPTEVASK